MQRGRLSLARDALRGGGCGRGGAAVVKNFALARDAREYLRLLRGADARGGGGGDAARVPPSRYDLVSSMGTEVFPFFAVDLKPGPREAGMDVSEFHAGVEAAVRRDMMAFYGISERDFQRVVSMSQSHSATKASVHVRVKVAGLTMADVKLHRNGIQAASSLPLGAYDDIYNRSRSFRALGSAKLQQPAASAAASGGTPHPPRPVLRPCAGASLRLENHVVRVLTRADRASSHVPPEGCSAARISAAAEEAPLAPAGRHPPASRTRPPPRDGGVRASVADTDLLCEAAMASGIAGELRISHRWAFRFDDVVVSRDRERG
eukprot:jgi/Tetstr1/423445/TSEL_014126.t1